MYNVAVLENKCADFIGVLLDIENCCTIATFTNNKKFDGLLENACILKLRKLYKPQILKIYLTN